MAVSLRRRACTWTVACLGLVIIGCLSHTQGGRTGPRGDGREGPSPAANNTPTDPSGFYRQLGMLAQSGSFPFVGQVRYLAGPSPDSSLALVTLSFANRALTFSGDEGGQRASYA